MLLDAWARVSPPKLLATVAVLAAHLPLEERVVIAHQMRVEADLLDDRKGLH
jgi:hypothetical protein